MGRWSGQLPGAYSMFQIVSPGPFPPGEQRGHVGTGRMGRRAGVQASTAGPGAAQGEAVLLSQVWALVSQRLDLSW